MTLRSVTCEILILEGYIMNMTFEFGFLSIALAAFFPVFFLVMRVLRRVWAYADANQAHIDRRPIIFWLPVLAILGACIGAYMHGAVVQACYSDQTQGLLIPLFQNLCNLAYPYF